MKRRNMIAGVVAAGAAVTAGLYRFTDLFVKHYPASPYDDVLVHLTDREQAARLGAHVTGPFDIKSQATRLRLMFQGQTFASAATADIATGRMVEVSGWLLPQTVVALSVLAARA
jgi:CRISPR/Cas system CMR subunit Cmr4 (Cas7 group RAMP superfamily)